jgi:hypothetical protein
MHAQVCPKEKLVRTMTHRRKAWTCASSTLPIPTVAMNHLKYKVTNKSFTFEL